MNAGRSCVCSGARHKHSAGGLHIHNALGKNLYFNQIGFVGAGNHHHHHDVRVWRDAHTDNMASTSVQILRVRGGGGVRLMVVKCVVRAAA